MSGSVTEQYEWLDGTLLCQATFGVKKKQKPLNVN